ncbi:YadA family autotransporter adhesin [Sphingomonas profundi]|uniref:YadA family autotransporter adhesin n=1 Tax=Alterirhizorhabdus profundi TaxID=2681549 RepID=UPI0012E81BC7|nr:YadA-like family protein [Sphingomonas profundi]
MKSNQATAYASMSAAFRLFYGRRRLSGLNRSTSTLALLLASTFGASQAQAQSVTPNLVSACSGISLPPSVVTGIIAPIVNGIVAPTEGTVNSLLGIVTPLDIDTVTLLANAAAGAPITLQVLNQAGTVVGPADRCDLRADSFGLNTQGGVAIGGNRITGLGTNGLDAFAGEASSIAFGNSAVTDATATGAIAFGTGAGVGAGAVGGAALGTGAQVIAANGVALGAGSMAARGALASYGALGLIAPQTSSGEVSVGMPGAERQITNVAAGSAPTDAVNVAQLAGVAAQVGTVAGNVVLYDDVSRSRVSLGGVGTSAPPVVLGNVAPGTVAAGSTEAVNGGQLFAANGAVTNNSTAITNLTNNVSNGALGPVRYADPAAPTVPNGGIPTNDVTLAGEAAGPVGLHNVRDGVLGAGSTDAVNGGQVAGLGGSVAAAIGGGSAYDSATNLVTTGLTLGGVSYGSIQAAFDAVNGTVNGGAGNRFFRVQSARGDAVVSADDTVAIGPDAIVSAANSVALGAGAAAARGANAGYAAIGLSSPQTSTGEVSIGATGAERQLTNVAAGSADTDAVNVAQLAGVAEQVAALGGSAVQYDGADRTTVTLAGAGGTTISNVRAGALSDTSTDAVNGAQLFATNAATTANSNAITNLTNSVANGGTGPVRYSSPGSATTPNGGTPTNDLTLVGAAAAPVALHNVASGAIAAGSTDAVNGGQIFDLALTAVNAVAYNTDTTGARTNTVTLQGGNPATPVTVTNVAPGAVAAGSTDAVNGGQLQATNQAVVAAQATAGTALTLGQNSVQYDSPRRSDITLGSGAGGGSGAPVALHNVAAGTSATDAVNVAQLGSGLSNAIGQANNYTDQRLAAVNFDLRRVRRDSAAGTAGALAAASLPQAYEAGRGMVAFAGGTYRGQSAFALGLSKAMDDGHTVVKLSGSYDTQNRVGGAAGVGYQF